MKPLVYLSIDIDFWSWPEDAERALRCLFDRYAAYVPVRVVMNHHQLLRHVDASRARTLLNLDYHSDFRCGADSLSCGSWVSYVRWRGVGSYIWLSPFKRVTRNTNGNCNWGGPWDEGSDWRLIRRQHVEQRASLLQLLRPYRLAEVGVSLSPSYAEDPVYDLARRLTLEYRLPYTRGVMQEDLSSRGQRFCYPPLPRDEHGRPLRAPRRNLVPRFSIPRPLATFIYPSNCTELRWALAAGTP